MAGNPKHIPREYVLNVTVKSDSTKSASIRQYLLIEAMYAICTGVVV